MILGRLWMVRAWHGAWLKVGAQYVGQIELVAVHKVSNPGVPEMNRRPSFSGASRDDNEASFICEDALELSGAT